MGFELEIDLGKGKSAPIRGEQKKIACDCWFTSTGKMRPRLIKYMDEEGTIQTIDEIQVLYVQQKNYAGIPSIEYRCRIQERGKMQEVSLVYFQEECIWVMVY